MGYRQAGLTCWIGAPAARPGMRAVQIIVLLLSRKGALYETPLQNEVFMVGTVHESPAKKTPRYTPPS